MPIVVLGFHAVFTFDLCIMKYIFLLFICLLFSMPSIAQSLSGTVSDSSTHQTLPGAVVYFPQLQLGATTDINGNYKITTLPKGTYMVEVEILGYNTTTKQISINGSTILDFSLSITSAAAKEVIITALGNVTNTLRSPVPVSLVTHDFLVQQASTNVVDGIATQPGITAITTGPGVSKPEIRGLGFNRVLTLFDGVRQQDFQWGDEHGIQIDQYAVYNAEIIRGPASLQYGSDAVGGVVSFKSAPFPEPGTVQGNVLAEYQTNNGLIGTSADVSGNENGFVWDLRLSNEDSHCYWDPKDGYVWGTASMEENARLVLGFVKKWGFSRLTVSVLHRTIEIPDGNRDSATGQFKFDFPINAQLIPNQSNFLSYNPTSVGYQQIEHDVISWQNSLNVGRGRIIADMGYTQDHREEIDTGSVPLLNMTMHDIPYSIKYQVIGDTSGLKLTAGVNGMYEAMTNAPEAPFPYTSVFLVPSYNLFDIGGYAILEKEYKNLTISGGLRYDTRTETGQSLYLLYPGTSRQIEVPSGTTDDYTNFPGFQKDYDGFSGCIGGSYQLPGNNYVKANISKSYRSPAITEVGENGIHPGTSNYEIGDPNLKPESGYEADIAYGNNGKNVIFEINGFCNYIGNFIFANRLASKNGGDSITQGFPTFKFQSNTAVIAGVEAFLDITPSGLKWFEMDNGFTYIYSYLLNQTDSTQHVPFTPAPRLTSDFKFKLADRHTSVLKDLYFKIGLAHYWAQNDIYSANWTELPSFAYTLLNAGIGTDFVNPKTNRILCSFYINVTNLANIAYVDHTSRPQYFLSYNGLTPVVATQQSQGIYNMGRNVGFKLVVPIGGVHRYSDEPVVN
jgi:iron complex outermembrane recepter protein